MTTLEMLGTGFGAGCIFMFVLRGIEDYRHWHRTPEKYIKRPCETCGEEFMPGVLVNGVDCYECWGEAQLEKYGFSHPPLVPDCKCPKCGNQIGHETSWVCYSCLANSVLPEGG